MSTTGKFIKAKRAIDHLPGDPFGALEKVWDLEDVALFLHDEIRYWFYMALSHEGSIYNEKIENQETFIQFYADLLPLIEASFCCYVRHLYYQKNRALPDLAAMQSAIKENLCHDYECVYITDEEQIHPYGVFARFCIKYPIEYVRRELWDFLDAVQFYSGPYRKVVSKHCFSEYYLKMLTMVEIAYVLSEKDQHPD
jgi:hypothetical protein